MSKLRILVADDNRDFCETMKDILEDEGHEVFIAYGGESAVELVQKEHFDLVLMDIVMPGMSGVMTIKQIRQTRPGLPITVITASGEEELIEGALQAGARKHFCKPVDFPQLLEDIERLP